MSEIAEKELAGEIYLAANRLNELMTVASKQHKMRSDLQCQQINASGGAVEHGHVVVSVYKFMERETKSE